MEVMKRKPWSRNELLSKIKRQKQYIVKLNQEFISNGGSVLFQVNEKEDFKGIKKTKLIEKKEELDRQIKTLQRMIIQQYCHESLPFLAYYSPQNVEKFYVRVKKMKVLEQIYASLIIGLNSSSTTIRNQVDLENCIDLLERAIFFKIKQFAQKNNWDIKQTSSSIMELYKVYRKKIQEMESVNDEFDKDCLKKGIYLTKEEIGRYM